MAFEKGKSGLPGGRSSLKPWTDAIRLELAASGGTLSDGLRKVARKVIAQAIDGDAMAWREIGDRLEGKPMQNLTATIKDARTATDAELTAIIDEGERGEGAIATPQDSQLTH